MTQRAIRKIEGRRLVYYNQQADTAFWENHWKGRAPSKQLYDEAARYGTMPTLEKVYQKHLPREGKILEAGCGVADMVVVLQAKGFEAEGVEWAAETVAAVKAVLPDLPVRAGDVTALDVPDNYYAGYVSLGVVEHRQAGPQPFLQEAFRVLRPGGIACISVPYLNPLRSLKGRLGFYHGDTAGRDFYQYAYSREEFEGFLRDAGLRPIDWTSYDGLKGVRDEIPHSVFNLPFLGWRLAQWLKNSPYVETHWGHMQMTISQKPA